MTVVQTDREQLIYECMIANLFEECKFFPKYPERQLRIAAVLFGEFSLEFITLFCVYCTQKKRRNFQVVFP